MSRAEWILLVLLIISIFINYIDRGNLSIAAPLIEKELALSPVQIGALLSSFFWTYALFQLFGLAGWLADRFPVKLVFSAGFLLWSGATIITGLLASFGAIYIARLCLGAGESLAYPCYSRIFAAEIRQEHRGRANALLDAGSKLGPAIGTFIGGFLLARIGWRIFFIALGVASLVWLVPWLRFARCGKAEREARTQTISVSQLFRVRSAWGTFFGHFCGNYFWFFLLTWMPSYLVKERGLSIEQMANIVSLLLVIVAGATISAGWVSDRLIERGVAVSRVRKSVVVSGLALSSIILPAAFVTSVAACIAFLIAACVAFGSYTSNHWAITQTLAGPFMAGRWTSVQNGIGSLSGVAAPWLAGFIVQTSGSSKIAFLISGGIALAGAAFWGALVGRVEEVCWKH
ncbi:MAG TPA: MFS transporter [Bryobacteraceae bacterium]|nr:MFS transporter [Bryobacteraceae bacterium]